MAATRANVIMSTRARRLSTNVPPAAGRAAMACSTARWATRDTAAHTGHTTHEGPLPPPGTHHTRHSLPPSPFTTYATATCYTWYTYGSRDGRHHTHHPQLFHLIFGASPRLYNTPLLRVKHTLKGDTHAHHTTDTFAWASTIYAPHYTCTSCGTHGTWAGWQTYLHTTTHFAWIAGYDYTRTPCLSW